MKNIAYKIILPVFSIFFLISCEDNTAELDLESIGFTGSTQDIQEFLTQDVYDALVALGVPVNTGNNPPEINGKFFASPFALTNTNIIDDVYVPGDIFANLEVTFSNQDNDELSINYFERQLTGDGDEISSSFGVESFVSGNSDLFTAIIKIEGTTVIDGETIPNVMAIVISGERESGFGGISNFEYALILISKNDPNNQLIEVGEGRSFEDSNSFSEEI